MEKYKSIGFPYNTNCVKTNTLDTHTRCWDRLTKEDFINDDPIIDNVSESEVEAFKLRITKPNKKALRNE